MSDCLHCDINQLVQERIARGDTDVAEMASMMVEKFLPTSFCSRPKANNPI